MQVLNLEQRSEQWFEYREGKISGSKAADYSKPRTVLKEELLKLAKELGIEVPKSATIAKLREILPQKRLEALDYAIEPNDAIYKLIAEHIATPIEQSRYTDRLKGRTFSMAVRGEILEDEARKAVSAYLGKEVSAGRVWGSDENAGIICSPDGEIIAPDGSVTEAVEIKCLDNWKMVKARYEGAAPADFHYQILQYFIVNEQLETLYFALYSDSFALAPDLGLQVFPIKRESLEEEIGRVKRRQESILTYVNQQVFNLTFKHKD